MNLRRQLLLVSLILLCLPWAGCQFVREIEGALRNGQEQSLLSSAQSMATLLNDQPFLLYPNADRLLDEAHGGASVYASPSQIRIFIDGYADGWEDVQAKQLIAESGSSNFAVSYRAVTHEGRLYLLLKVRDPQVIYHNPNLSRTANGDRLILRTWLDNRKQDYVIATTAPGKVWAKYLTPVELGTSAGRIRGQWQDSETGYTLELEIPLSMTGGRLGFYVVNASEESGETAISLGNITLAEKRPPPWLIYSPDDLHKTLAPFTQSGWQLQVIDKNHWLVAQRDPSASSGSAKSDPNNETFWLLRLLYRSILSQDTPQAIARQAEQGKVQGPEIDRALNGQAGRQRYRDPQHSEQTTLAAAAPILHQGSVIGALVIRQSSEEYLSLTDKAFDSVLGYSLAAIGAVILSLLGYASVLSWRVRSLSRAASEVVRKDGIVLEGFPRSRVQDEIGELSRSYADLLEKLRQYNEYLRTLSQKLSHELRTPIAVIQTSLENLEQRSPSDLDNTVYLERARDGLSRLGNILNAMSEASGLEESIRSNVKIELDLAALLREVFGAYQTVYSKHRLSLDCQPAQALIMAAPELLVQALDKLMDNAASFCPEGGAIELSLQAAEGRWILAVSNEGPQLPESMHGQLFNSLVSVRQRDPDHTHLGLGLHIVQLIADFHNAQVAIDNVADGSGVRSAISLAQHCKQP